MFQMQPPFYSRDTHEMYDNILHKPLVMRSGASSTAWSLLQGLLEKDNTLRLGSNDDFVSDIKSFNILAPSSGHVVDMYNMRSVPQMPQFSLHALLALALNIHLYIYIFFSFSE